MESMNAPPVVRKRLSADRIVRAGSAGGTAIGVAGEKIKAFHYKEIR